MPQSPFRLVLAQAPADLNGIEARLAWLANMLPEVAAHHADLLLLPELFACGYNIGAELVTRAEPANCAIARTIADLARTHGLAIHYGYAETADGTMFNSAQCFGPDGARLGGHRKLAIPPGFEQDHFTPGAGTSLFTYRGLRIATLICYDAELPETVRHVASQGAELVLVPTALGADWAWVAHQMIPTRAFENGVFLAYANSAGDEHGMAFLGSSVIAAPDGRELARAGSAPMLLMADLHHRDVAAAQARLPYLSDRNAVRLSS